MEFASTAFWAALGQIILFDLVLSGDNAVVIALAVRSLPPQQQKRAVLFGSMAAVAMRVTLTMVAVEMLRLPYLKLVGAALLLWIGIQLLLPEDGDNEGGGTGATQAAGLGTAIRTILIADLVMSLDNVIAVAAAAKGSLLLLIIGLGASIPLVVFGSAITLKLMDRFPVIITIGGALLGYVAGEMVVSDPALVGWIDANAHWLHGALPLAGAAIVVLAGKWLAARRTAAPLVDLAEGDAQRREP